MKLILFLLISLFYWGCAQHVAYKTHDVPATSTKSAGRIEEKGKIYYLVTSYYGRDFHGRKTASGEKYNMYDYTCAHKEFSFGTKLRVTDEETGKSVVVRVNDRGPFVEGRGLDLSFAAAKKIGLIPHGIKEYRVQVIK